MSVDAETREGPVGARDRVEIRFEVPRAVADRMDALCFAQKRRDRRDLIESLVNRESSELEHAMTMYARITGFNPLASERTPAQGSEAE